MKISKVNNTRTGIGLQEQKSVGMIYMTPKGPDARTDIQEHIKRLNQRAQKLYSPFNSNSIKSMKTYRNKRREERVFDAEKSVKDSCKRFFRNVAKQTTFSKQEIIKELEANKIIEKFPCMNDTFCEDLIAVCLKKSLARNRKNIKKIKECVKQEEGYNRKDIVTKVVKMIANILPIEAMSEQEWKVFYYVIHEDYHKEKQIEELVKSFENKDTKVQVFSVAKEDKDSKELRLELSNINNPKKQYISEFIHAYAGSTMEEQKELLIHQRRLLLLYVCGPEKYALAENVDLMPDNWGGLLPEAHENMSEEIYQSIMYEGKKLTEQDFNNMRMERYGKAIRVEGLSDGDKKWIGYFNDEVGKIFHKNENQKKPEKIGSQYMVKQLWKGWTSFIAMKYIDIGKAVYHFAMPHDKNPKDGETVAYGVVQEPFQNGLTSFDYEQIKAKETIARELAVYTTFAVNIFSRATVEEEFLEREKKDDVLLLDEKDYDEALKSNVRRRILQYFGGQSRWKETELKGVGEQELFKIILEEMKIARNANYHYSTVTTSEEVNSVLEKMFQFEKSYAGIALRKKYYSNNTLMFYSKETINNFMQKLYSKPAKREPQVPSFGNVFKKQDSKEFLIRFVSGDKQSSLYEGLEQLYAAFYFMAKEIYYYDFLQLPDLKTRFENALKIVNEKEIKSDKSKKNTKKEAKQDFINYINKHCKNMTFGELCQCVMTEYNQQNQNFKEVRMRVEKEENKEIYQHFRMLLYATLKVAFETYLKENDDYRFLTLPTYKKDIYEKISESEFCENYTVSLFDHIEIPPKKEFYAWYVIAHFITAKQLNHLQGAVKDYLQFLLHIEKRAESTCNKVRKLYEQEQSYYENLHHIFSVVMVQSGQISHNFDDYFDSEEEYAEYLAKYVEYTKKKPSVAMLKAFCNENIFSEENTTKNEKEGKNRRGNGFANIQAIFSGQQEEISGKNQKIGIYCDDMHPILNKNIMYSKLFGFSKQISNIFTVRRNDIKNYYTLKDELGDTFKKEQCNTEKEQRSLRKYQDIKNKVELYDVTTYTELMIDCMAQLVSYGYLRERDSMYMQLGFHYLQLFYGRDRVEDKEESLLNISKGAILYQIYSIYNYDSPMIEEKKGVCKYGKPMQLSTKISKFINVYSKEKYLDGMYFFENVSMHDKITERRNYIEHMKYLSAWDVSILDMYCWMYNGFFDYDTKLKKSMSFILNNILMKYFVGIELKTEMVEQKYDVEKSQYDDSNEIKTIILKEMHFEIQDVISETFIYKKIPLEPQNKQNSKNKQKSQNKQNSQVLELAARSEAFRTAVRKLLEMHK